MGRRSRRESSKHELDHGDMDERFRGLGQNIVFFAHPTVAAQPSECSFNDPSPRQDLEALLVLFARHDFQINGGFRAQFRNPAVECSSRIAAIGPDLV